MNKEPDHHTTVTSVAGKNADQPRVLVNLSPLVDNPLSISSVIARFKYTQDAVEWAVPGTIETWLTSMEETPGGRLFAVSMDGILHYATDDSWTQMDLHCPRGLSALWSASDRVLFSVGMDGQRVIIKDMVPQTSRDNKGRKLYGVHGTSPDDAYVVGEKGAVFHYQKGAWSDIESPTNARFLCVLCHEEDVYLGGDQGTFFRMQNDAWEELHFPKDVYIHSLAWYDNSLFVAGGPKGVFRLGPEGFENVRKETIYRLKTVGDMLFVMGDDFLARFNGSKWQTVIVDI